MDPIIILKAGQGAPTNLSLQNNEPVFDASNNHLYVGKGMGFEPILFKNYNEIDASIVEIYEYIADISIGEGPEGPPGPEGPEGPPGPEGPMPTNYVPSYNEDEFGNITEIFSVPGEVGFTVTKGSDTAGFYGEAGTYLTFYNNPNIGFDITPSQNLVYSHPWTYIEDFSNQYDERSLIDKGYADEAYLKTEGGNVGGETDYLSIDASGTLRLYGAATTWDDLVVPLTTTRIGANNKPDFDFDEIAYMFPQNNTSEILYFVVQMPHRRKIGSNIHPHVHYRQATSDVPVFKLDYKWFNIGSSEPTTWNTYIMDQPLVSWTDSSTHQLNTGALMIDGSSYGLSSMMLCKLYRDDNIVTGDVAVWQFDIHIEIDSFGSNEEFSK